MARVKGGNRMKSMFLVLVLALLTPVAALAAPSLGDIRHALVGTWQSTDDTKFTRELSADGVAIDRYEGDSSGVTKGTWIVFDGHTPPPDAKGRDLEPKAIYLELKQDGDTLFFALTGLSSQSLQLIYLERGNQLSFTRLK